MDILKSINTFIDRKKENVVFVQVVDNRKLTIRIQCYIVVYEFELNEKLVFLDVEPQESRLLALKATLWLNTGTIY